MGLSLITKRIELLLQKKPDDFSPGFFIRIVTVKYFVFVHAQIFRSRKKGDIILFEA